MLDKLYILECPPSNLLLSTKSFIVFSTPTFTFLSAEVNIVSGAQIGNFVIQYADLHKGLFSIKQVQAAAELQEVEVKVAYMKAGEAGVPTNLDWDGCVGMVQILLQK